MHAPVRKALTHAVGPDSADATDALIGRIDALLPQTQCTRCGYAGCLPYAQAIARAEAPINRCPPGGQAGIEALARLLHAAASPLDAACGSEEDHGVAWIDPAACIGCARCLPACPVDAIIGAARFLHGVHEAACNGCELCIASCPVDCIHMRPRAAAQIAPSPAGNRRRYARHLERLRRESTAQAALLEQRKGAAAPDTPGAPGAPEVPGTAAAAAASGSR
jgi:H+/Na+-translocating ferredoxin:NAD+ oxidoreductase subunit B